MWLSAEALYIHTAIQGSMAVEVSSVGLLSLCALHMLPSFPRLPLPNISTYLLPSHPTHLSIANPHYFPLSPHPSYPPLSPFLPYPSRCIKMTLVHDLAESIVGDLTPADGVDKEKKHQMELVSHPVPCPSVSSVIITQHRCESDPWCFFQHNFLLATDSFNTEWHWYLVPLSPDHNHFANPQEFVR